MINDRNIYRSDTWKKCLYEVANGKNADDLVYIMMRNSVFEI